MDVPRREPVAWPGDSGSEQVLNELRGMERTGLLRELVLLGPELGNDEAWSWRNQPGCTRPGGAGSKAPRTRRGE